jgi:magnesium chelatase subunit I
LLYVDEVNLLDDHLVDILLDSAASGWNTVEREGISIRHPARFVLVGSGNPEEGDLRPQLLDRFGMQTEVMTEKDPALRVQIVEERTAFDQSPLTWIDKYEEKQQELRQRIVAAQKLLPNVKIDHELRIKISLICSRLDVEGLRGDIVATRAAQAHAAYHNRDKVTFADIKETILLCLVHRLRKDPLDFSGDRWKIKKVFEEVFDFEWPKEKGDTTQYY